MHLIIFFELQFLNKIVVGVGGIWSMVRIPPWGKVRAVSALGGAHLRSLWVVVTTSSSSHNLAVRGKHQENGACTRAMHAKRLPNKVHNHAMAPNDNVCSYFFSLGGYSD